MAELLAGLDARFTRGRYGPFSASGSLYVVARAAEDPARLRMMKRTGGLWTAQDDAARPQAPGGLLFVGVAAFAAGSLLYVVGEVVETSSNHRKNIVRVRLWTFDTASDTWSSAVVVADQPYNGFDFSSGGSSCDVVVTGAGVAVLHHGMYTHKGSTYMVQMVAYREAGGAFASQSLSSGGVQTQNGVLQEGTAGRVHLFYQDSIAPRGYVQMLSPSGVLSAPVAVLDGAAPRYLRHGGLVGTEVNFLARAQDGTLRRVAFASADVPVPATETASTETLYQTPPDNSRNVRPGLRHDGTDYEALYIEADDQDIRSVVRSGGMWAAPTTAASGVASRFALSLGPAGALWATQVDPTPRYDVL